MDQPRAEIRKHYFLDRYVVVAPGRLKRPQEHASASEAHDTSDDCVFCPGHEGAEPEIARSPASGDWRVRVIPNKFPALSPDNPRAFGYQEIVIDTPDHGRDLGDFTLGELETLLEVYAARTEELASRDHVSYVLVFKNDGGSSGASLTHAHSQIAAFGFIPPDIAREIRAVDAYHHSHGRCVYCDVWPQEAASPRLIWEDEHAVAFAPYAAADPYEAWIVPKAHRHSLHELGRPERTSVAAALRLITGRLEDEEISYNYYIHNSVGHENHHLHIEITPRITLRGGLELGSGVIINPVAPEETPHFYHAARG